MEKQVLSFKNWSPFWRETKMKMPELVPLKVYLFIINRQNYVLSDAYIIILDCSKKKKKIKEKKLS